MDKLEKQVSRLPKKDLSKGQRSLLSSRKYTRNEHVSRSLSLFLSLCLPKKLIKISKFISPLVFARAFIILILQHLIDILQH